MQFAFTIKLIFTAFYLTQVRGDKTWQWKCNLSKEACTRTKSGGDNNNVLYPSLEICRLVCGKYSALWPKPTGETTVSTNLFKFPLSNLKFKENPLNPPYLKEMSEIFLKSISLKDTSNCAETLNTVTISFTVLSNESDLKWNTDESYQIKIATSANENSVQISARTVFGARHGLETLSQLIDIYSDEDDSKCHVIVAEASVVDAPVYKHRGLLLDTARNFQSVGLIKKHIDAMTASKLNVLHWHVTDSQSFPLEISSVPNMIKFGAYSDDKIYKVADVQDLMQYAKLRGIRVLIEIDAPSHSGNGWQWGPDAGLGNLAVCINQEPWNNYCIQPPCGQLNPINDNLYKVLEQLYGDVTNLLPKGEFFHMGGDELYIACWNSTQEIIDYLGDKPRTTETFLDLWSQYQTNALKSFDTAVGNSKTPIIVWTSRLTSADVIEKYLDKTRYIIQTWVPQSDPLPNDLVGLGYQIIVSTKDAWYLDHGFWGKTVYHDWEVVYNNVLVNDSKVLGGEVCMWGELVDDYSVEPRVWPRAAAAAERLWSNPNTKAVDAKQRFYRHRERLVSRGIQAEAVTPKWCYQNEGQC